MQDGTIILAMVVAGEVGAPIAVDDVPVADEHRMLDDLWQGRLRSKYGDQPK